MFPKSNSTLQLIILKRVHVGRTICSLDPSSAIQILNYHFQSKFSKIKSQNYTYNWASIKEFQSFAKTDLKFLIPCPKKLDQVLTFSTKQATQPQMFLIYSTPRAYSSNKKFPEYPKFQMQFGMQVIHNVMQETLCSCLTHSEFLECNSQESSLAN